MQKRDLFAIGIVVLCGAGAAGYYEFNKAHEDTRDETPVATVSAGTLYTGYQSDEPGSNGKYLGKVIEVRGHVTEINQNDSVANLVLGVGSGGGINCSFGRGGLSKLKNIHAGDSVSCKGRCTGFLMDVNLSDCVIEP